MSAFPTSIDRKQKLIDACEKGAIKKVAALLDVGEVRQMAAARENEALRVAVGRGQIAIVKLLLKLKDVQEAAAAKENEALRDAVNSGRVEIVRLLLEVEVVRKAIVARENGDLLLAVLEGSVERVAALLNSDGIRHKASAMDNKALCWAASLGHVSIVKLLLEIPTVKAAVQVQMSRMLSRAFIMGHAAVVELLLQVPVDEAVAVVQEEELPPTEREVVNFFRRDRAAGIPKNEALSVAIIEDSLEEAAELPKLHRVSREVTIQDSSIELLWAVHRGDIEMVKRLLKDSALVEAMTLRLCINLCFAIRNGHIEIATFLLGVAVVRKMIVETAECGNNVLNFCIVQGNLEIVSSLLESDVIRRNVVKSDGLLSLAIATDNSIRNAMVYLLLEVYQREGVPFPDYLEELFGQTLSTFFNSFPAKYQQDSQEASECFHQFFPLDVIGIVNQYAGSDGEMPIASRTLTLAFDREKIRQQQETNIIAIISESLRH